MKYIDLKKEAILRKHTNWYFSIDLQDYGGDCVYRKFDNFFGDEDFSTIEALTFSINRIDRERVKRLPSLNSKFEDLKSLSMPLDWIDKVEVPRNIESLNLLTAIDDKAIPVKWPENIVLERLTFLKIPGKLENFDLDVSKFQSLEWVSYDFSNMPRGKANTLTLKLAQIKNLKHLIFSHVKNVDVFTPFFNHRIETLELAFCRGNEMEINKVNGFKNLRHLYLNNIGTTIFDCKLIDELPDLIELNLLNVKNVVNIDHVLNHKNLKIFTVRNCGNPFQGEDMSSFEKKSFEHLDIAWA